MAGQTSCHVKHRDGRHLEGSAGETINVVPVQSGQRAGSRAMADAWQKFEQAGACARRSSCAAALGSKPWGMVLALHVPPLCRCLSVRLQGRASLVLPASTAHAHSRLIIETGVVQATEPTRRGAEDKGAAWAGLEGWEWHTAPLHLPPASMHPVPTPPSPPAAPFQDRGALQQAWRTEGSTCSSPPLTASSLSELLSCKPLTRPSPRQDAARPAAHTHHQEAHGQEAGLDDASPLLTLGGLRRLLSAPAAAASQGAGQPPDLDAASLLLASSACPQPPLERGRHDAVLGTGGALPPSAAPCTRPAERGGDRAGGGHGGEDIGHRAAAAAAACDSVLLGLGQPEIADACAQPGDLLRRRRSRSLDRELAGFRAAAAWCASGSSPAARGLLLGAMRCGQAGEAAGGPDLDELDALRRVARHGSGGACGCVLRAADAIPQGYPAIPQGAGERDGRSTASKQGHTGRRRSLSADEEPCACRVCGQASLLAVAMHGRAGYRPGAPQWQSGLGHQRPLPPACRAHAPHEPNMQAGVHAPASARVRGHAPEIRPKVASPTVMVKRTASASASASSTVRRTPSSSTTRSRKSASEATRKSTPSGSPRFKRSLSTSSGPSSGALFDAEVLGLA